MLVLLKVRDLVVQIMVIMVEILTSSDFKPMVVVEVVDQEQVTTLKMVDLAVVVLVVMTLTGLVEEIAEVDAMIEEAKKPRVVVVEEGERRMARVYGIPSNKFLRLIEFRDGTHGKVRCKPGKYYIGDEMRVKDAGNGM